jgi:twitching motility protein PilI
MSNRPQSSEQVLRLLFDFEQRSQASKRELPTLEDDPDAWQGLAFMLDSTRLVCAMSDVAEMFAYPEIITRVPGAKDWVVGLVNVRGNLLPMMDLQRFFGAEPVARSKAARLLVSRERQVSTGLLVPGVLGMRQFSLRDRLTDIRFEGSAAPFVREAFQVDGQYWPIFNIRALLNDPRFRVAAA